ncbi:MAG: helix-turn-helix domain-containing protein [Cytophagia bacterium]|nr:MAG: helix-turn-helix domain-containing protein [Cytophagia bacterium]TAG42206.1 MAG: helix-turn-helix domain-containing protein [Cytophagia bacterium]
MEIGQKIKKLRELRNFSQQYMAEKLEIAQQTYSKMEMGDIDFPISRLKNISDILGIRIVDIFSFDEKSILNSYNNNAENITTGFIISDKEFLDRLTNLYESRIEMQQKEIDRLHILLQKMVSK